MRRFSGTVGHNWFPMDDPSIVTYPELHHTYNEAGVYIDSFDSFADARAAEGATYFRVQVGLDHCGEVLRWSEPSAVLRLGEDGELTTRGAPASLSLSPELLALKDRGRKRHIMDVPGWLYDVTVSFSENVNRKGRPTRFRAWVGEPDGTRLSILDIRAANHSATVRMDLPKGANDVRLKTPTANWSLQFTPVLNAEHMEDGRSCGAETPPSYNADGTVEHGGIGAETSYWGYGRFYNAEGVEISGYHGSEYQRGSYAWRMTTYWRFNKALKAGAVYNRSQWGLVHCGRTINDVVRWGQPTKYLRLSDGATFDSIPQPEE